MNLHLINYQLSKEKHNFLKELAELIIEVNKEYYDIFKYEIEDLVTIVSNQLDSKYNELSDCIVLLDDKSLVGFTVGYPSNEKKIRQINSLKFLLKNKSLNECKNLYNNLNLFKLQLQPIESENFYHWIGVGVRKCYRQLKYGSILTLVTENEAIKLNYDNIVYYVNRYNFKSIALQLKYNAKIIDQYSKNIYNYILFSKLIKEL